LPAGRKSKYLSNIKPYFDKIERWLKSGIGEMDIAKSLDVSHDAWAHYKRLYNEFNDLVEKSRIDAVKEVVSSLFKLCTGFDYNEQTVTIDAEGKRQVTEHRKKMPPNIGAIVFYLTNRDKLNWENTQKQKFDGTLKGNFTFADFVKKISKNGKSTNGGKKENGKTDGEEI